MADATIESPPPSRRRDPIAVKWHHGVFEISLLSMQALTAAPGALNGPRRRNVTGLSRRFRPH